MKATDLMIGDWVQNPLGYKAQVLDIHYIKDEGDGYGGGYRIHIGKSNLGVVQWLEEKDIEPIPLTPKILEKNGFLKSDDFFCMAEDFYDIDIIEISDGIWRVRYDNLECSAITDTFHICFVHELQHALRLCKINKEIEL